MRPAAGWLLVGAVAAASFSLDAIPLLPAASSWTIELHDRHDHVALEPTVLADAELYPLTDSAGNRYTCLIPAEADASAGAGDAESNLSAVEGVLRGVESPLLKQFGYWTYSVAFGTGVSQIHGESPVLARTTSPPAAAASSSAQLVQFSLGSFSPDRSELVTLPSGSVALRQQYASGTDGRASTVVVECEPAGMAEGLLYDILSVQESKALHYTVRVGTREPALCSRLVSVPRLLTTVNGTCVRQAAGWWQYDICVGGAIRQFHAESGNVVQENVLGVYSWRAGESIDTGSIGEGPAILQVYDNGTPCDLLQGKPRKTIVRFECAPGSASGPDGVGWGTTGVQEVATCTYKVTIGASAVCEHPTIAAALGAAATLGRPVPERTVHCVHEGNPATAALAKASVAAGAAAAGARGAGLTSP